MSSVNWELQKAVYSALNGVISAPVYDEAPHGKKGEYVTIGAMTAVDESTDRTVGFSCTITLHSWSVRSGSSSQGFKKVYELMGEVYDVLNRGTLTAVGYTVLGVDLEFEDAFRDPDGRTRHGVQRFRAILKTN